MIRPMLVLALAPLLSGCIVTTAAGLAVDAAKTTARAAGTVVGTAVDAATTTQSEADEDRGRALRLEEERQRKEEGRRRKEEERQRREAVRQWPQPAPDPAPADIPDPSS